MTKNTYILSVNKHMHLDSMFYKRQTSCRVSLVHNLLGEQSSNISRTPRGGGGVLDPWLGIGVPLRVSNPDPV